MSAEVLEVAEATQETGVQVIPVELNTALQTRGDIKLAKAQEHAIAFLPSMQAYHELAANLNGIDKANPTPEDVKIARETRLKLVKVRTGAAPIKDERKALLTAESNLIQSLYNVVKDTCAVTEGEFEEIEKHFERQEAARIEKVKADRLSKLEPYGTDTTFIDLGAMTDEQFASFLEREKFATEAKIEQERLAEIARVEAEKKAEADRIAKEKAEKEERERIEAENAKLKAEQERLIKEQEAERKKLAEIQAKKDEEAKKEAERVAEIQAEKDKAAKAELDRLAAIAKAEREASEKAAAEAKAKADADAAEIARVKAELKAKEEADELAHEQEKQRIADEEAERIAKAKAESLAPDKAKINKMYLEIKNFQFPELSDPSAIQIVEEVKQGFDIILKGIVTAAKTLK